MEHTILITESLDIASVTAERDKWRTQWNPNRADIRLMFGQSVNIDTAGLQLILAFRLVVVKSGHRFLVTSDSEPFWKQAEILGVAGLLQSGDCPTPSGSERFDI